MDSNLPLNLIVFGPAILGLLVFIPHKDDKSGLMNFALSASIVTFLYSLTLIFRFDPTVSDMQYVTNLPWISVNDSIKVDYHIGIDGISLFLVLLTTFITPIAILSTQNAIKKNYKQFLYMILLLESAILGVFVSLDLVLFYIFWEVQLIPMYFLIGVWGSGNRINSAMKFVLFTMIGSVLMLVAILVLYGISYNRTFDIVTLYTDPNVVALTKFAQGWMFWAFFVAFAIKVPLWPVHTWL
ncbi:MAG TPA: proton-conducting transporter membrane subunit, partial [bacterium]